MEEDLDLVVFRLKRRISELQQRLDRPKNWTNGELEIFRIQIKLDKLKLLDADNSLRNKD